MSAPNQIIERLFASWSSNPDVEAIFLFGSHATNSATPQSDIDLCVVLREGASFDFPGICRIEGHLVETFSGSRAFFEKFFEQFHKDNSRIGQTQFATGRILFDRNGEGAKLQAIADQWLAKPRITQTVEQAYWPKRIICSSFDRLERIYQSQRPDFVHAYHSFLQSTYAKYAAFLGEPVMNADRLFPYLTDAQGRAQYLQQPFGDPEFADLLVAALVETHPSAMLGHARKLHNHAIEGMGGLVISSLD